jgi:hypothetical protein
MTATQEYVANSLKTHVGVQVTDVEGTMLPAAAVEQLKKAKLHYIERDEGVVAYPGRNSSGKSLNLDRDRHLIDRNLDMLRFIVKKLGKEAP